MSNEAPGLFDHYGLPSDAAKTGLRPTPAPAEHEADLDAPHSSPHNHPLGDHT